MELQPGEAKIIHRQKDDPMVGLFKRMRHGRHSLLGIFEFAHLDGNEEPSITDLLIAAGINGYTPADMGQEGTYAPNKGNFGGHTTPLVNKAGKMKSVIFIRHNIAWDDNPSARDMICRVTMAHELQHSDDMDGTEFVPGKIDNVKMELDAHHAALKMAKGKKDQDAVAFYLATLHQHLTGAPEVAAAARQFMETSDYKAYFLFAGSKFEVWMKNCTPP